MADVEGVSAPLLAQFFSLLQEQNKIRTLAEFSNLDAIDFAQCLIYVRTIQRADALANQLLRVHFPAKALRAGLDESAKEDALQSWQTLQTRILVVVDDDQLTADDTARVDCVAHYDMAADAATYLRRVADAKGISVAFIVSQIDRDGVSPDHETAIIDELRGQHGASLVELTGMRRQLTGRVVA